MFKKTPHKILLILVISCPLILGMALQAQDIDSLLRHKRQYEAKSIGELSGPKIDGELDDEIWSLGKWQGDFIQQFPRSGRPATERSYFKILYDHSNLYVAIVLQDSDPDAIVDRLGGRDSRSGDMTGFALDSYFDKRTAFEFSMSVAGQKTDLKHLGDWGFDQNWNAVWDGATTRTDTGWIAEIQLPFSQIRYANQPEHVWGLHIYRVISRKSEASSWDPIPREAPATVYLFGELKGIENIRSSRQVEFLPYVLGSVAKMGDASTADFDFNGGLDAKVGISSDFTLDLSVNPDFGQVEADPSELNLTSFETFFEEKRPFFLEGNDVFDFEMDGDIPYYSRRIGSTPAFSNPYPEWSLRDMPDRTTILGAAKLTGKNKNGLSVGLVNGLTASASAMASKENEPDREIEFSPLSNYLASRIKKDFQEGNTVVGGVFSMVHRISPDSTSEMLLPSSAISGGIDLLQYWKNKDYFLEAKVIASQMKGTPEAILRKQLSHIHRYQRPDADHLEVDDSRESLGGHGGLLRFGKNGGRWNFLLQGQYRSPGLNLNDMGFLRQADFLGQQVEVSYQMNEPGAWVRNYLVTFFQEANWSFGKENTGMLTGASFMIRNNKLWSFSIKTTYDFSSLDTRELRGGPALRKDPRFMGSVMVSSNSAKDFYGSVSYQYTALGRPKSSENMLMLSLNWVPLKRLKISGLTHLSQRIYHQQYVSAMAGNSGTEYVVGNMDRHTASFTFRTELYLTPEMSIQYYGSPYYSVGNYDAFRRVAISQAQNIDERLGIINPSYDPVSNTYAYLQNGEAFQFGNPDFSFMEFRSNLVFRWEYKLGSTLYLVWAHDRLGWESSHHPIGDIAGDLWGIKGNHIFMVKANFWFSL